MYRRHRHTGYRSGSGGRSCDWQLTAPNRVVFTGLTFTVPASGNVSVGHIQFARQLQSTRPDAAAGNYRHHLLQRAGLGTRLGRGGDYAASAAGQCGQRDREMRWFALAPDYQCHQPFRCGNASLLHARHRRLRQCIPQKGSAQRYRHAHHAPLFGVPGCARILCRTQSPAPTQSSKLQPGT